MTQATTVPPIINQVMKFVLRSPMHALVSQAILLISFTGRKSGKTYTTPVSYSQSENRVTIFTYAAWWKNLCNGKAVTLHLRGREIQGLPEVVAEDKQAIATGLTEHLRQVPSDARWCGVTIDSRGNPNPEEVQKAAQTIVMIHIRLC